MPSGSAIATQTLSRITAALRDLRQVAAQKAELRSARREDLEDRGARRAAGAGLRHLSWLDLSQILSKSQQKFVKF